MGKKISYEMLGIALRALSDACMKAAEQERNGEKVTSCGMSDKDLEELCDILPMMMNPMMSTEEVKELLGVSDSTLNRMVGRGELPKGESKKHVHTRYWKKWDVMDLLRRKRSKK